MRWQELRETKPSLGTRGEIASRRSFRASDPELGSARPLGESEAALRRLCTASNGHPGRSLRRVGGCHRGAECRHSGAPYPAVERQRFRYLWVLDLLPAVRGCSLRIRIVRPGSATRREVCIGYPEGDHGRRASALRTRRGPLLPHDLWALLRRQRRLCGQRRPAAPSGVSRCLRLPACLHRPPAGAGTGSPPCVLCLERGRTSPDARVGRSDLHYHRPHDNERRRGPAGSHPWSGLGDSRWWRDHGSREPLDMQGG